MSVSNVLNWLWAEGLYVWNSTLDDCSSSGRPRYQQVGGIGFLWYDGGKWYGGTVLCDSSWSVRQFYGSGTATDFLDQVAAQSWYMTNTARTSYTPNYKPALVTSDDCSELYIYFSFVLILHWICVVVYIVDG